MSTLNCAVLVATRTPSHVSRDAAERRGLVVRNQQWTARYRLPPARALGLTWRALGVGARDGAVRRAFREAVCGAPWVARERRCVSARVRRVVGTMEELPA